MRNLSKTNVYDLHLKKRIHLISVNLALKLANSEVLFEKYRMALNQDKYDIEVRYDDAIKRNRIFFDFMQQTFSCLDGLYMDEKCHLIDTIKKTISS